MEFVLLDFELDKFDVVIKICPQRENESDMQFPWISNLRTVFVIKKRMFEKMTISQNFSSVFLSLQAMYSFGSVIRCDDILFDTKSFLYLDRCMFWRGICVMLVRTAY